MSRKQKNYSPEFKIPVIMDMREHHLGYRETVRKYRDTNEGQEENYKNIVKRWERIFLEEGAEGLMKERRGRACKASGSDKGRPPKLDKKVEEDLIAENQKTENGDRILKKTECLSSCGRAKEREKAFIIAELRQKYPLKDLLALSGIARSTYYYYLKQKDKDK